MYVGLVNDELQGHGRKWMNCNLWCLPTDTEERHSDSLCMHIGIRRRTSVDSTLILKVLKSNVKHSILWSVLPISFKTFPVYVYVLECFT